MTNAGWLFFATTIRPRCRRRRRHRVDVCRLFKYVVRTNCDGGRVPVQYIVARFVDDKYGGYRCVYVSFAISPSNWPSSKPRVSDIVILNLRSSLHLQQKKKKEKYVSKNLQSPIRYLNSHSFVVTSSDFFPPPLSHVCANQQRLRIFRMRVNYRK